jgi:hypothetical protein
MLSESGDLNDIPVREIKKKEKSIMSDEILEQSLEQASQAPIPDYDNIHLKFENIGSVQEIKPGKFEIIAISAGNGNGWEFTEQILQESLPLWDGTACFIDHGTFWSNRSIKDLAGVLAEPVWSIEHRGIKLTLTANGPAGEMLDAIGRELLKTGPKPNVGFSADVWFKSKDRKVMQITRVESVDLVFRPARGGAFIRSLNSQEVSNQMEEQIATQTQASEDVEAVRQILEVQKEQQRLSEEAEKARQVRAQMCSYLLDSGLAASKLPAPMQEHIKAQFQNRVFEPSELTAAIEGARKLVSDLVGSSVIQGPGARIHGMFTTEDQLQLAVDDLLGVDRDSDKSTIKVHQLTGIRELYHILTGDYDMHGGFHPDRVSLATTSDFAGLVKNALNKTVINQWRLLGRAGYDWWQRISVQEHFTTLNGITGTLVGTVGTLPAVSEGAEYTELAVGDSPETASFTKYGGYIPLTLELIDRDETRKLRAYPRELANAAIRKISALVAAIFTDNAGVGPTMADTGALFNATAVTTAGGHLNLLTTALSASEWEVVSTAVYNQPMLIKQAAGYYGTGPKQAINPRFCVVPRPLELTAKKILYPALENSANIYSENLQRGAPGDVITVPEWTDANNWAAVCDPIVAPAIFVGERFGIMPEVFIAGDELSPAVFMNDEHRLKVRHFLAVWVNDFRPLHKSNV